MKKLLLLSLIFVGLGGCVGPEAQLGAYSYSEIDNVINHKCVKEALQDSPNITDINHTVESKSLKNYRGNKVENHLYKYSIGKYNYSREFRVSIWGDKTTSITHSVVKKGGGSIKVVNLFREKEREFMRLVEKKIIEVCNLSNKESLFRDDCFSYEGCKLKEKLNNK